MPLRQRIKKRNWCGGFAVTTKSYFRTGFAVRTKYPNFVFRTGFAVSLFQIDFDATRFENGKETTTGFGHRMTSQVALTKMAAPRSLLINVNTCFTKNGKRGKEKFGNMTAFVAESFGIPELQRRKNKAKKPKYF